MTYPDPDDPVAPARPGVRPFLQSGPQHSTGGYTPTGEQPPVESSTNTLRPFVITSGRTDGGDPDIGMETQVTLVPGAPPSRLSPETRAIVALCEESPISVAEISARLRLHLGVTRILVGDLRATGQLDVHVLDNDTPDPDTIMRVIRGLRSIS
ncbi:hypothetical protein Aph02nite_93380 [Actinoplanes philippinensis]|uniref:DUF742 domain-containing protein n=1 Tax=Actinoplanes philippinensis TaxID=35752 RepID=A0A1I2N6K7_9ACTN|nr:DUF742 domain-containing protein [Actinoplanes philippinensis]GIE83388.1 hypothetical protein Aph02nite_93380 [Actinoplanes philippinensis]SFF99088.1 Protein of unknown function [Actinoplanes philippinensis]